MSELNHTKNDCTANNLCLGGISGLFCGNCGAGLKQYEQTYSAVKVYKQYGQYIVEQLVDVSDTDNDAGASDIYAYDTRAEQMNKAHELLVGL